jgi:AcrR family transcriptional regulator
MNIAASVCICRKHTTYTFGCQQATTGVQPPGTEDRMGRRPQIDEAAILDAAMDLADERGLEAVTMHAVAQRLGVTPMALYRHVDGKQALLDGLVERLLTGHPLPPAGAPWPDRLTAMAEAIRATARAHPAVFPLLLTRPAVTPGARRVRDSVQAALGEAGLGAHAAARAERLISTAVFGFAASEAAGRFSHHDQAVLDEDFAELLRWLRLACSPAPPAGQ